MDKGIKETINKLNYDIDFEFIERMAYRMERNKDKYSAGNWKKPMDIEVLKQALFRHTMAVMQDNYDDVFTNDHLVAIACNAFMLHYQIQLNDGKIDQGI